MPCHNNIPCGYTMKSVILVLSFVGFALAAPASQSQDLQSKIDAMETHIQNLEKILLQSRQPASLPESQMLAQRPTRALAFQPMKRMVAWQPMKRSNSLLVPEYSKEQVIRAVEEQLLEILRAGETLGANAEEVLSDLRRKNGQVM
ncbi:unnamed protein product [Bursaphelenchus okinawaensis]|uniref:Uncharacterized protein n=1 Tax=Bursaphelenchus okinawaensis TaxID=465554 RepID=A0A811JSP4_9BILA|nr:unnamed protein product [Bursaphelenchus okinawaensis]CAG9081234.1 unnamed protein product [Bursaphelenchus okinawaensis]